MPLITIHRLIKQQRPWVSFAGFLLLLLLAVVMTVGGLCVLLRMLPPPLPDSSLLPATSVPSVSSP